MKEQDWYRNKTWDDAVSSSFEAALLRARPDSRAQYIRIQAVEIADFNKEIAKELLHRILNEYPESKYDIGPTKDLLAGIYTDEQNYKLAEQYYRDLLQEERTGSSMYGYFADIKLLKVIVLSNQQDKYEEAYQLVKQHNIDSDFLKSTKYEFAYLAARLCKEINKVDEAKEYAKLAIDLLNDPTPSAPSHPGVGDIQQSPVEIDLLNKILNS